MPIVVAAAALLGLSFGSFLTVVFARVPAGESIVRPTSRCPNCAHAIRARHNVPVLGWLMLRGRCADCADPISIRYPLIELAAGAICVAAVVLAQLVALRFSMALGLTADNPFPSGEVNRVVQGVTIHPARPAQ